MVPGTQAATIVMPRLAQQLASLRKQRDEVASEVERLVRYARKVQQGKRHNQALIALARRRCDVLFAMLRDGTFYKPKAAPNA